MRMKSNGENTMYKNILLTILALAVLTGAGAYTYVTIDGSTSEQGEYRAKKEAKKQCAHNIPDEDNSLNSYGMTGYSNYTNYPKFDRCMASKGF